jgi:hypothetical protein
MVLGKESVREANNVSSEVWQMQVRCETALGEALGNDSITS